MKKTNLTILDVDIVEVAEWARINEALMPIPDPASSIPVIIALDILEALVDIGNRAARANVLTRADEIILVMAYNAAMAAKYD